MPQEALIVGPYQIFPATRRLTGPGGEAALSPLELRFLCWLHAHQGVMVSGEELLREVWGYHPSVRSKAVPLLVSRLRKKIGEDPEQPRLILTGSDGGYGMPAAEDRAGLIQSAWRLYCTFYQHMDALLELDQRVGALGALLEQDLTILERARVELALGVWALERQPQRSALPLWTLSEAALPEVERALCAIGAAKLMSTSGLHAQAAEALAPWLDRCPAGLAGQTLRGEIFLILSNQHRSLGALPEAEAEAQQALELAEQVGDALLRGRAMGVLGAVLARSGDRALQAEMLSADGAAILRAVGAELLAATAEASLGVRLFSAGRVEQAAAVLAGAAPVLRRAGRALDAAMTDVNLGVVRLAQRDPQAALALAERSLTAFQAAADYRGEGHARLLEGRACCVLGAQDRAQAALERCLALARRQRAPKAQAHAQRYLAWLAAMGGRPEARALAAEAQAALARLGQPPDPHLALWLGWLGGLAEGAQDEAALLSESPGAGWVDARLSLALRARRAKDEAASSTT